jgi:hypothetical protein
MSALENRKNEKLSSYRGKKVGVLKETKAKRGLLVVVEVT